MTLGDFLTSVANAIRGKKGTTEKIPAANFASEIESIITTGVASITRTYGDFSNTGNTTTSSTVDRVVIGSKYIEVLTYYDSAWPTYDFYGSATMNGSKIELVDVDDHTVCLVIPEVTGNIEIRVGANK